MAEPSALPAPTPPSPSDLDREVIGFWVGVGNLMGYSRSVGEIFGLVFLSEAPLSADEIAERLGISRSGVGQGLKALQEIGAIRPAHQLASRKEYYRMQTDLGILARQLLNTRVFSPLEELARIKEELAKSAHASGNTHLVERFDKLQRWQEKARPVVAILRALTLG